MKNIYYFAKHVYQYGHAKPIYDYTGGTFIVNKLNRIFRFKYYLRNSVTNKNMRGSFGAPKIIKRNNLDLYDLEGVIISGANVRINYDKKNQSQFLLVTEQVIRNMVGQSIYLRTMTIIFFPDQNISRNKKMLG